MNDKALFIMRGLPGSGKSHLALDMAHGVQMVHGYDYVALFSTEDIWKCGHHYHYFYNSDYSHYAHQINQLKVRQACADGIPNVIVDNTNITFAQISPYIDIAKTFYYDIVFVEPKTAWKYNIEECYKNTKHKVPLDTIKKMWAAWESTEDIISKCLVSTMLNFSMEI